MNTRRKLIASAAGLLALAGTTLGRKLYAADSKVRPLLSPTEPMAVAIAYVEVATKVDTKAFPSYRRGQSCVTCSLVEFGTGIQRGCTAVPGRLVKAGGWCKLWQLRGGK